MERSRKGRNSRSCKIFPKWSPCLDMMSCKNKSNNHFFFNNFYFALLVAAYKCKKRAKGLEREIKEMGQESGGGMRQTRDRKLIKQCE